MLEQQSSLPVPITITRSGSFWFEDGSVVPVAPNKDGTQTSFRVHRSVLARRSDVLRDMLTVPQPAASDPTSCVEGCPAVHVADAAEDWEIILHVLYDGGYRHFGHSRSGWSMVPATLRHGSKCALRSVYTEATARMIGFSPVYASNFALLEELSGESSDLTLEKDDLMKLAQLSHDTELPLLKSIQCAILYVCAYLPANDLVHGVKKNRWSAQFLKLCLSTKGMLDRAVGRVWQTLWAGKRSPNANRVSIAMAYIKTSPSYTLSVMASMVLTLRKSYVT